MKVGNADAKKDFVSYNFYFAYSYQLTINELAGYNSGTHMITIGLDLLQSASNCACTKGSSRSYYR